MTHAPGYRAPAGAERSADSNQHFDRPNIRYMLMEKFKPLDQ